MYNNKAGQIWLVQYGILAQLGEHLPYKQRVTGSSPVVPTINKITLSCSLIFLFYFKIRTCVDIDFMFNQTVEIILYM